MAKDQKQVAIFLGRKITLERKDKDPVSMTVGRNVVDADVAEHPFVKSHLVSDAVETVADAELQARVEAAEAKVAELQAIVDAYAAADASKSSGKK